MFALYYATAAVDRLPLLPLTKFEGGLNLLQEVDDDAVIWQVYSDCSTREIINCSLN